MSDRRPVVQESERGFVPPNDPEAEKHLLTWALAEFRPDQRALLAFIRSALREGDFYFHEHRRLWFAICSLLDAGEPVTMVRVCRALHAADPARSYASALAELPTPMEDAAYWLSEVQRIARRRRLYVLAGDLLAATQDQDAPLDEIVGRIAKEEVR